MREGGGSAELDQAVAVHAQVLELGREDARDLGLGHPPTQASMRRRDRENRPSSGFPDERQLLGRLDRPQRIEDGSRVLDLRRGRRSEERRRRIRGRSLDSERLALEELRCQGDRVLVLLPRLDVVDRRISRRILHAGLTIRDAAAADRFYKDVLGFSEIWRGGRPEGVTNWINMRVPEGTDYLEYMLTARFVEGVTRIASQPRARAPARSFA